MKIEISNKTYNRGVTKVCELIDFVALDPKGILEDIAKLCDQVEKYELMEGVNLKNTLVAMGYYFENDYEALCRIYPQYKKIPRIPVVEEIVVSETGRPMRSLRARK